MPYRVVLFDGYGTLFAEGMERLIGMSANIAREVGLDMDGEAFLAQWDEYFFPLIREGDFVSFRTAHEVALKQAFRDLDVSGDEARFVDRLFVALGDTPLYDDVKPTLSLLNGTETGVVSNADTDHLMAALRKGGLSFEYITSSESARAYKPDPAIFDGALMFYACGPGDILYVGDSQEDDIVGATRAGIDVAWLNRDGAKRTDDIPPPTYEITSLAEVPSLLA